MKDHKAAKELANRALVDLRALDELVGNPRVADEIFGFLAQQAAEKSLKGWLALLGKQFPITHNLAHLEKELQKAGVQNAVQGGLLSLNPFAVQFRYEIMDSTEPELDRRKILKMVRVLVEKVSSLVAEESEMPPGVHEAPAVYRAGKPKMKGRKRK